MSPKPRSLDLLTRSSRLGSIDVLVYNSGAIWWSAVETTPVKRFQLMQRINPEGLYAAVSACLPHFSNQNWKARIIVVSPPIYSRFFRGKTAYAMGKVGMSVLTKGLAMDFVRQGRTEMAITSIWPAVSIESAATEGAVRSDQEVERDLRKPVSLLCPFLECKDILVLTLFVSDHILRRHHRHDQLSRFRSQRPHRS
jgi:NAD(P)-dependent dehydrogenase (short-subunit alcohol dehydrogenase family)